MLTSYIESLTAADGSRPNPLAVHLKSFSQRLTENGYANSSIRSKLWLLAGFGRWLARRGHVIADLDESILEAFLAVKRRKGGVRRGSQETVIQFLNHLRDCDVVPTLAKPVDASPLTGILSRYETHLRSERGLTSATVINYVPFVRKFLVERFGDGPLLVGDLHARDISAFVLKYARTMSCGRAQLMTTAFRSFFRFAFYNGKLKTDLACSVPTVADWRLASVPKYLTHREVERVLSSCNRETGGGRRDYAILMLLARLGLRAGEIVALQLGDIDWRAGEVLVRGKGLLHDRMPLPPDVGEALSSYLHLDRPDCKTRQVFICTKAPRSGLAGPSTVSTIVRRALGRAGLNPPLKGAHILRHSLATTMLRSGASMGEIGEVLRHRIPSTTEIYAKVDFEGLRSLAHVWPSGGAQ